MGAPWVVTVTTLGSQTMPFSVTVRRTICLVASLSLPPAVRFTARCFCTSLRSMPGRWLFCSTA